MVGEPRERRGKGAADRGQAGVERVEPARRRPVAGAAARQQVLEQEHQQLVRRRARLAHPLALAPELAHRALDRALEGNGGEAQRRQPQRLVPGVGEGGGIAALAQPIGGARGDAGLAARLRDAARLGEHGQEGALPLGGPAVVAGALAGDGAIVGEGGGIGTRCKRG